MNPLADLTRSFRGWAEIVAGKPGASENFRTDGGGLTVAAITLLIAILLSLAAQAAAAGIPGPGQVLFGLLAQALTVSLLALVMARALKFLQLQIGLNTLLVPVLYALSYVFVLSVPLAVLGPNAGLLALLGLAVLIWRAGMVLARMKTGPAIAFALLCLIVLVVVPNALYMLLLLVPSA